MMTSKDRESKWELVALKAEKDIRHPHRNNKVWLQNKAGDKIEHLQSDKDTEPPIAKMSVRSA